MGSAVAGLRAKDKSKSDIDASAHVMRNPYITVEKNVDTTDPATLVGLKIRIDGKDDLVRMNPCQPPESILSKRRRQQGDRSRFFSQQVFFHENKSRRRWLSYSLSKDSLFCLPGYCLQVQYQGVNLPGKIKAMPSHAVASATGRSNTTVF